MIKTTILLITLALESAMAASSVAPLDIETRIKHCCAFAGDAQQQFGTLAEAHSHRLDINFVDPSASETLVMVKQNRVLANTYLKPSTELEAFDGLTRKGIPFFISNTSKSIESFKNFLSPNYKDQIRIDTYDFYMSPNPNTEEILTAAATTEFKHVLAMDAFQSVLPVRGLEYFERWMLDRSFTPPVQLQAAFDAIIGTEKFHQLSQTQEFKQSQELQTKQTRVSLLLFSLMPSNSCVYRPSHYSEDAKITPFF